LSLFISGLRWCDTIKTGSFAVVAAQPGEEGASATPHDDFSIPRLSDMMFV
jgi:hypothetical protein